ncbi:MAG TPA: glycosyltransferase [Terracidiphilus sp.]|nr:glycosyltransferase [Terracidiphilus sp.]
MASANPEKVLITGGHELGGVGSVADALQRGFLELGIPAEVISPSNLLSRRRELRDQRILKLLSTTAVFAAPLTRRAICIAHGIPCADVQGWRKLIGIISSFKIANASGAQLAAVSEYTAIHLRALFNIRVDAVIRNPLKPIYLETAGNAPEQRRYITFVGRLNPAKNLHRLLPAICDLLEQDRELCACIIGDGVLRKSLQESVKKNERVQFLGSPNDLEVRDWLRKTKIFVSGNAVEGLGVTYLEALSQGCIVAMPASGGGIELALDRIGSNVQLLPISLERGAVFDVLKKCLQIEISPIEMGPYRARAVAVAYLSLDARRLSGMNNYVGDRSPHALAVGRSQN